MKTILTALIVFLTGSALLAQDNKITFNGTVEYTKTINVHAISRQTLGKNPSTSMLSAFDDYKKRYPQFAIVKSTLDFDRNQTLFNFIPTPANERVPTINGNPMVTQFNNVYTDLSKKAVTIKKMVYQDELLIVDSVKKITWRLTDETRDVAGYTCRRANGLYMDSISVVAFYTDKIRVSGGPESFSGLPGMILCLVVPHENIRFDATKVNINTADVAKIVPPKSKSKPINYKQLDVLLQGMVKTWGALGVYEKKVFSL
jgi:GLPGLI family protein